MKKTILSTIIVVGLIFLLRNAASQTSTDSVSGFTYITDGSSITIMGYSGPAGEATVPSVIAGLPVTSINYPYNINAASYDSLTSIIIPGNVIAIGDEAFRSCTNLQRVVISNGVSGIGDNAFYGCYYLQSISIPDSVSTFGSNAFGYCHYLTAFVASRDTLVFLNQNKTALGIYSILKTNATTPPTFLLSDLTSPALLGAIASNSNFISSLASAVTTSPSIYGILQQGPQGIPGPVGNNGVFDPAVLTNTVFIQSLATNQTFLAALASNPASPFATGNRANQTISFLVIPPQSSRTNKTITLKATSSVGATPIIYSIQNTNVATVTTNGILSFVGSGTATVKATQTGNANYNPATAIQTVIVK